jgi:hypothetical protein
MRQHFALTWLCMLLAWLPISAQPKKDPPKLNVNLPPILTDKSVKYDYDIIYVRAPRFDRVRIENGLIEFQEKKIQPTRLVDAQQLKFNLWPVGADVAGGSWGVSLGFYARFRKDGSADRNYQGTTAESITKDTWKAELTMINITGRVESVVMSSYTCAEPEYSDDKKIITQRMTLRLEKKIMAGLQASLRDMTFVLLENERNNSLSFEVVLKMKAGHFSVSAELPSGERLGTDGWKAKGLFAKTVRLANDGNRNFLAMGSAKCWAEISTRKLPE